MGSPVGPPGASTVSGLCPSGVMSTVGNQRRFDEDVKLPLIKVVVLGAPGVGKTSVVKVKFFSLAHSYFALDF